MADQGSPYAYNITNNQVMAALPQRPLPNLSNLSAVNDFMNSMGAGNHRYCLNCGQERDYEHRSAHVYCSEPCWQCGEVDTHLGRVCPCWDGGLTLGQWQRRLSRPLTTPDFQLGGILHEISLKDPQPAVSRSSYAYKQDRRRAVSNGKTRYTAPTAHPAARNGGSQRGDSQRGGSRRGGLIRDNLHRVNKQPSSSQAGRYLASSTGAHGTSPPQDSKKGDPAYLPGGYHTTLPYRPPPHGYHQIQERFGQYDPNIETELAATSGSALDVNRSIAPAESASQVGAHPPPSVSQQVQNSVASSLGQDPDNVPALEQTQNTVQSFSVPFERFWQSDLNNVDRRQHNRFIWLHIFNNRPISFGYLEANATSGLFNRMSRQHYPIMSPSEMDRVQNWTNQLDGPFSCLDEGDKEAFIAALRGAQPAPAVKREP